MANRDRHRQGLVYGPVRPSGPRDRGRILGNLLGLLFVVATIAFLGFAIYFFIQNRATEPPPPGVTPSPVSSVAPSPSPAVTPSAQASSVAVVTPAPSAPPPSPTAVAPSIAPGTTPAPTMFVPQVMVGPGFVTFGTTADDQLRIVDPKTTFGLDEPMVWSAYLTGTANSADLRIRILKFDPNQLSGQALVRDDPVKPDATDAQIFFRRLRPIGSTYGAGLYTIEYVRGDQVMSTGSFLVQ